MSTSWNYGQLRDGAAPRTGPLVVKLGGSILRRRGWPREVADLIGGLPGPRVIVVGGGPLVDGLRAIDATAPQPADLVHRLAIECMGLTARLVAAALGHPLVAGCGTIDTSTAVLDVPAWLNADDRHEQLPVGWQVTSDSIAAFVAAMSGCSLLLVKSVAPPHDDVDRLAQSGWVDACFPTAARPLARIGWTAPA